MVKHKPQFISLYRPKIVLQSIVNNVKSTTQITRDSARTVYKPILSNNNGVDSAVLRIVSKHDPYNMKKKSALSVLVVDDDELSRELMRLMLVGSGITVLETDSGIQALQALYAGLQPDVIILDAMMPDITGFEVCQQDSRVAPIINHTDYSAGCA